MSELDFDRILIELRDALLGGAESLLEGAAQDVEAVISDVASGVVAALRVGDSSLSDELKAAMRVVAETNRVRAVNGQWELLDTVVQIALGAAGAVVRGMVTGGIA